MNEQSSNPNSLNRNLSFSNSVIEEVNGKMKEREKEEDEDHHQDRLDNQKEKTKYHLKPSSFGPSLD